MAKGVSDRYLQAYWRKAVLLIHGNTCIVCGNVRMPDALECHHVIKRRHRVLKHDPKNGVPVCAGECHQFVHTRKGERTIELKLGDDTMDHLETRQTWLIKDYRFSLSHSKEQHEKFELAILKKIVEG
jgi:hypothetical protein